MLFRVLVKKSLLSVLTLAVALIVLLNIISQWEVPLLRIGGIALSVFCFTLIFFTIEYFIFRRLNPPSPAKEPDAFDPEFVESEISNLEELVPVEEENEFGELLEVEDPALQPVEFSKPAQVADPEKMKITPSSLPFENIEELEVLDDLLEELEAIDE